MVEVVTAEAGDMATNTEPNDPASITSGSKRRGTRFNDPPSVLAEAELLRCTLPSICCLLVPQLGTVDLSRIFHFNPLYDNVTQLLHSILARQRRFSDALLS
jgi:hypothetical protein